MKKKNNNNKIKKEEIAEDYCFVCKDGGLLLVCEYKDCLKAYHPECVGKDDSFLETGDRWTCNWHSCFICQKTPKFHCFCCPNAVCGRCIHTAEFARIRGKRGFCNHCLKLALLVEENMDVDSDGGKIDFKDRETYEFMFKEYWEIIKEKEGITLENLHSADVLLKKGENNKCGSDSDDIGKGEEENQLIMSDYDDMDDIEEEKQVDKGKRSKEQVSETKRKAKSKKNEFIGWGSKALIEFLASIGTDTSKQLSQYDVSSIINKYIRENKLFHPEKKKKVLCDARLQSILRRKSVNKNKIYDLLETHFSENLEQSEEDETGYSSEYKDENVLVACKRQRKSSSGQESQKKEVVVDISQSCFASIIPKNINLVYLKRRLVGQLLKEPDTFEGKVIGSFVRVKSNPNDYLQRNSHQLFQVTGIKKTSGTGEINTEILLQVSNMPKDICISMLSEDDFSEEECEDLRQRVKDGLLKKPTIMELEQKARSLHEDITNHRIERELAVLNNLIDRANEKGWRKEFFEYMERRRLLQTSEEKLRLLQEVPKVIADVAELEPASDDSPQNDKQGNDGSPKSIIMGTSKTPSNNLEGNGTSSCLIGGTDAAGDGAVVNENPASGIIPSGSVGNGDENGEPVNGNTIEEDTEVAEQKQHRCGVSIPKEKQHCSEASALEELPKQSHTLAPGDQYDVILQREPHQSVPEEMQHGSEASVLEELPKQSHGVQQDTVLQREPHQSIPEEMQHCSKASVFEELPQQYHILAPEYQSNVILHRKSHPYFAGEKENRPIDIEQAEKNQRVLAVSLIELSDDDDDDKDPRVAIGKQTLEDPECSVWQCVGPRGERKGPYSLSLLKRWSDSSTYASKFKVWKMGESQENAIFLTDAIRLHFLKK